MKRFTATSRDLKQYMSTYILGKGIEMETSETNASTRYENIQKKTTRASVYSPKASSYPSKNSS